MEFLNREYVSSYLSTLSDVLCIGYVLYNLFQKKKTVFVLVRDEDWVPEDVETDSEEESCSDDNTTNSVSSSSDDDEIVNEIIDLVSDSDSDSLETESEHGSMPPLDSDSDSDSDSQSEHGSMPPLDSDSDSQSEYDEHRYMSDSTQDDDVVFGVSL